MYFCSIAGQGGKSTNKVLSHEFPEPEVKAELRISFVPKNVEAQTIISTISFGFLYAPSPSQTIQASFKPEGIMLDLYFQATGTD